MLNFRRLLIAAVFAAGFVCFASTGASAQAMASYLFLEVIDSDQKPVADAKVEKTMSGGRSSQTDEEGKTAITDYYMGVKPLMPEFVITKPDYYSFQDFGTLQYTVRRSIKVEMLKIPKSKKELKTAGDEQSKREFFWAVQKGDTEAARKLLKSGINPNLSTGDLRGISGIENIPAIIYPANSGDGAMIKLLLEKGADIRRKEEHLSDILFYYLQPLRSADASQSEAERAEKSAEYDQGLKALIKAGAAVNAKKYGNTPLITAVRNASVSAVKILAAGGADVNLKDDSGSTALKIARNYQQSYRDRRDYQEIVKALETVGAKE